VITTDSSRLPNFNNKDAPSKNGSFHLPFLDGIRALMALWVASGHAVQDFIHVVDNHSGNTNFLPEPYFQQAFFAHFAVDVFIVVSGFCLMLPVVKTEGFALKGGWRTFLYRRAKRILPPYYAALLLSIAMSGLRWWITKPGWESRVISLIDFRPSALLAHLFLVQNMWDTWAKALDGPTWSVATESQIYILFPLLLLPLWRRFRPIIVIVISSGVGIAFLYLTWHSTKSGLTSCAWYLGLFAMGMWSAERYIRGKSGEIRPVVLFASVALISLVVIVMFTVPWSAMLMWKLDFAIGAAVACLIAYLATATVHEHQTPLLKLLEWQPLAALGRFSYSFYLIHVPLLNVPVTLLLLFNANEPVAAVCILITFIGIIAASRQFYKYIELPSMAKRV
jgi:peptidoglycan/LPS O-acetylase OafA/YrhL